MRYDIELCFMGHWIKVSETRFKFQAMIQAWSYSDLGPTRVVDTR